MRALLLQTALASVQKVNLVTPPAAAVARLDAWRLLNSSTCSSSDCCAGSAVQQQQHLMKRLDLPGAGVLAGRPGWQPQQHMAAAWLASAVQQPVRSMATGAPASPVTGTRATRRHKGGSSSSGGGSSSSAAAPATTASTPQGGVTDAVRQHNMQQAAKSRKAAEIAKFNQHEFRAVTLNTVLSPYTRPPPLFKALADTGPQPKAVWRLLYQRCLEGYMRWYVPLKAQRNCRDMDRRYLPDEVAKLYLDINTAQAKMQPDLIRDLVSKEVLAVLQARTQQRQNTAKLCRIVWEVVNKDKLRDGVELVQARLVKSAAESPFEWIQLTYCITSQQRFAAYRALPGGGEELVQGDPNKVIEAEDHWVIERKMRTSAQLEGSRWRLVGELKV